MSLILRTAYDAFARIRARFLAWHTERNALYAEYKAVSGHEAPALMSREDLVFLIQHERAMADRLKKVFVDARRSDG